MSSRATSGCAHSLLSEGTSAARKGTAKRLHAAPETLHMQGAGGKGQGLCAFVGPSVGVRAGEGALGSTPAKGSLHPSLSICMRARESARMHLINGVRPRAAQLDAGWHHGQRCIWEVLTRHERARRYPACACLLGCTCLTRLCAHPRPALPTPTANSLAFALSAPPNQCPQHAALHF